MGGRRSLLIVTTQHLLLLLLLEQIQLCILGLLGCHERKLLLLLLQKESL